MFERALIKVLVFALDTVAAIVKGVVWVVGLFRRGPRA